MIWFVLVLALVLRLVGINQSLWLDEAIGALAAKSLSYEQIISEFSLSDNHPPFYYLLLKFWTDLWGFSELALRSLSVIFGLGTIFLTYKIAQKIKKDKFFVNLVTLLITTSQIHVYYSQEARMYMLLSFLVSLSFWLVIKQKWFWYSLVVFGLFFTDYVALFFWPVLWLLGRKEKNFYLAHLPLAVLGILWMPIFLKQSAAGKWLLATLPAWKQVAGGATFKQLGLVWAKFVFGRITLADKNFYYLLVLVASTPFLLAFFLALKKFKSRLHLKKHWSLWMWLFLPLLLGFGASFFFPAFIYFRFIYVLPAFYLVISLGVIELKKDNWRNLLAVNLLAVNILGLTFYYLNIGKLQQREEWRQVTNFIEENAKEKSIVIFGYPEPPAPWRWYEKGRVKAVGVTDSIAPDSKKTQLRVKEVITSKEEIYYFEYLVGISNPKPTIEKALKEAGFEQKKVYGNFAGVGYIYLWQK